LNEMVEDSFEDFLEVEEDPADEEVKGILEEVIGGLERLGLQLPDTWDELEEEESAFVEDPALERAARAELEAAEQRMGLRRREKIELAQDLEMRRRQEDFEMAERKAKKKKSRRNRDMEAPLEVQGAIREREEVVEEPLEGHSKHHHHHHRSSSRTHLEEMRSRDSQGESITTGASLEEDLERVRKKKKKHRHREENLEEAPIPEEIPRREKKHSQQQPREERMREDPLPEVPIQTLDEGPPQRPKKEKKLKKSRALESLLA